MTCTVTLAVGLVFTGCKKKTEALTIGLGLSGIQTNSIFIDMRRAFEERCNAAGYKLIAADLTNGVPDMLRFLENCITAKAKVVIYQNIGEDSYINLLEELKAQGAILGSSDNPSIIAPYSAMVANYDTGLVIGRMCGEWVESNPGSKKIAITGYESYDFLAERARGMRDGFAEKCPSGKIVFEQDGGWVEQGIKVGEALITAVPDVQAVMGINDSGPVGVGQAFAAQGWTFQNHPIGLFGCDASEDGMRELRENGMFKGTVYMDLLTQMMDLFDRCLETAKTGVVNEAEKIVYFPAVPITLQNADIVGQRLPKN
jgi:ABC-type sugar transport system substrate-binding protein